MARARRRRHPGLRLPLLGVAGHLVASSGQSARQLAANPGRCRRAQQSRGLLPLYLEDAPVLRVVPRRRTRLLGDGVVGSDYLGLVAPARDMAALAPRVAAYLVRTSSCATPISWSSPTSSRGTSPTRWSPSFARPPGTMVHRDALPLSAGLARGARARRVHGPAPRRLRLAAAQAHRAPRARARVPPRRPRRARGRRRRPRRPVRLHRLRWAQEGGSEAFTHGRVESFHRAAGRLLAERGFVRLAVLNVGDARSPPATASPAPGASPTTRPASIRRGSASPPAPWSWARPFGAPSTRSWASSTSCAARRPTKSGPTASARPAPCAPARPPLRPAPPRSPRRAGSPSKTG